MVEDAPTGIVDAYTVSFASSIVSSGIPYT